jgi:hypothetical protein
MGLLAEVNGREDFVNFQSRFFLLSANKNAQFEKEDV